MYSTNIDYKKLYDRVGGLIGWDFSNLQVETEDKKWNFYKEVVAKAKSNFRLLDIGTGGGEAVLKIRNNFTEIIGIDFSVNMIMTAKANLKKSKATNVIFKLMDAKQLEFQDNYFDIVSDRHCEFSAFEIARVLKPGGYFLTQQVSEGDKLNIKQAFGRGQDWGVKEGIAMKKYITKLKTAGFVNIKVYTYNVKEWYKSAEDLIFLLRHTPIIPNFGKKPEDFAVLDRFIADNSSQSGILTNSKRYMLIARLA
ncbi:MAG: class I SAM-dependent methyltransferase [Candidatus Komeilibacteria bacterium]